MGAVKTERVKPGDKAADSPKLARVVAGLVGHERGGAEDDPPDSRPEEEGEEVLEGEDPEEPDTRTPLSEVPEWFQMPAGVTAEEGSSVRFMRIPAKYTAKPKGKERQCLLTMLTLHDERLALQRASVSRDAKINKYTVDELAKQCVRVVDGARADWSGRPTGASVNRFWADVGPKIQKVIRDWYLLSHTMGAKEEASFFADCVEDQVWGG